MSLTLSALIGNTIMALIIGSVFYNLGDDTSTFYARGALLFFAVLLNAFSSALEVRSIFVHCMLTWISVLTLYTQILTLYAQRPIVEKHARYALYHPFAEAAASMICDLPYKFINATTFNITLYFMTNLRREPGAFFIFYLFSIVTTLTMSMVFRTIAASSRTLAQALVPAAILILGLVIYTGFTIPTRNMLGWSRWMNYIDPISYAFESFMVNEFHDRTFPCAPRQFVPAGLGYENVAPENRICSTVGATAGSSVVEGNRYLRESFRYEKSHLWRNLGIMFAFMGFFMCTYLIATEYISEAKSKGEVLLFRRGHQPAAISKGSDDVEKSNEPVPAEKTEESSNAGSSAGIQRQTAIFHWKDVCYDIKIKGQPRRILDHVDGWVKPGTCTALMVSTLVIFLQSFGPATYLTRVSRALERPRSWMYSLLASPWVL